MATNRLGFDNYDEICRIIVERGFNEFTNHKTGIHLLRVGQSVCVIKQFKNNLDLEYEKLVWLQLSDDLRALFVPCEFFENVLIMKPVIDFFALLESFANIAMNITEICIWLMALLIAIFYVNMLQRSNLYFTDVKMQNFGIMLNEDGTIRVVLIDIGSICIHIKPDVSRSVPMSKCGQTYCPLSLFLGISHPDVTDVLDAKTKSKKRISVVVYFAFIVCLYQILTNNANSAQQFYCGSTNVSQSYKFIHGLAFSLKVFEKYKIILQEIFNLTTKCNTLDDLQNAIKRVLFVLNHANVLHLFADAHPDFVVYFNQSSTVNIATIYPIDSSIDDIFKTTVFDPTSLTRLTIPNVPPRVLGVTSVVTSVDNDAIHHIKSALSSTEITKTFEYNTTPRFRAIDVVDMQFMSHLKNAMEHIDSTTIVKGILQVDDAIELESKVLETTQTIVGGNRITIKPYPKQF